jgi:hypothetical protein
MTVLLRGLDALVTSRYHAAVLSMAAAVPQIAVGHDLRLRTLYQELGLDGELFVEGGAGPEVFTAVSDRLDRLLTAPEPVRQALRRGERAHAELAARNRVLLRGFAAGHGWDVGAVAAMKRHVTVDDAMTSDVVAVTETTGSAVTSRTAGIRPWRIRPELRVGLPGICPGRTDPTVPHGPGLPARGRGRRRT